jgi:hypothetical protein
MPLTVDDDPKSVYAELATFDSTLAEWSPNSSITMPGHYNPNGTVCLFPMGIGALISKTFETPQDISMYTEIAMWLFAQDYYGMYLTLSISSKIPGDPTPTFYSTTMNLHYANDWEQITWDISALPDSILQNVKYIQITSSVSSTTINPVVAFEELVARRPTMLEAVYRQIKYLFHEQVSIIANDGQTYLVPALTVPEYDVAKLPAFVYSIGSAVFDTITQGRVIERAKPSELIGQTYKMREGRSPYLVSITVEVVANFQEETLQLQEFILATMPPRGALSVAGDVIDCLLVMSNTAPTFDTEQRQFRFIYEYSLWTWFNPADYTNVASLQSVAFNLSPTTDVTLIGVDEGITALDEAPNVYIEESKPIGG